MAARGDRRITTPVSELDDHQLLVLLAGPSSSSSRVRDGDCAPECLIDLAERDEIALRVEYGLRPSSARRLAAAVELHRRLTKARRSPRPPLLTPESVAAYLSTASLEPQESLWCLPLDAKSRLIGFPLQVSRGDVDGTDAGPRLFFRSALRCGATSAIACHNHPSGDPSPSLADEAVTRRLVQAGQTIDVRLVDHVVLGHGGSFVSLRRERPALFGR